MAPKPDWKIPEGFTADLKLKKWKPTGPPQTHSGSIGECETCRDQPAKPEPEPKVQPAPTPEPRPERKEVKPVATQRKSTWNIENQGESKGGKVKLKLTDPNGNMVLVYGSDQAAADSIAKRVAA